MNTTRCPTAATVGLGRQQAGASLSGHDDSTAFRHRQDRRPLYSPEGKVCAVIVGGVLKKAVEGSKHFLRQPPAIALDLGAVQAAEADGVSLVVVIDRETSAVYQTTITELHERGFCLNRGFGEQIAMRLDRWQRKDADAPIDQRQPVSSAPNLQLGFGF